MSHFTPLGIYFISTSELRHKCAATASWGVTFLPPGEQVSGGGVLVMFRGLEPQLEGEDPRILIEKKTAAVRHARPQATTGWAHF